jgi:hypothetical protein
VTTRLIIKIADNSQKEVSGVNRDLSQMHDLIGAVSPLTQFRRDRGGAPWNGAGEHQDFETSQMGITA